MVTRSLLAATFFATFMGGAFASQCNFDQKRGDCVGAVRILSQDGSTNNHSAELEISSSTGACAKVEYYLHDTPQTAIIRSAGVEYESVFGTAPLKASDIRVIQCTAYAHASTQSTVTLQQDARYGRCVNDQKMVAELDQQYRDINAMIADETLAAIKEMQDYFAADNHENPRWLRRQQILSQCL